MIEQTDVSRETLEKLSAYHALLLKWNTTINLVSKPDMNHLWERHIWDSSQVYTIAGSSQKWLDIGSGGGFPGIIVAILAAERHPGRHITMVESDTRKSVFLRTVIRDLCLPATVVVDRVERISSMKADILTARALADFTDLLVHAQKHLNPNGHAFFFKGASWKQEVEAARKIWSFDLNAHKSRTREGAAILEVRDIQLV